MRVMSVLVVVLLAACASELHRAPTSFSAINAGEKVLKLNTAISIQSAPGYLRTLPAGSTWRQTGAIPEGDVYKIENSVFTVEARHMHEAYLVVRDRSLVGFYLPVEKAFSPLSPAVILPTQ